MAAYETPTQASWVDFINLMQNPGINTPLPVAPAAESPIESFGGCTVVTSIPDLGTFYNAVVITMEAEANATCDITVEGTPILPSSIHAILGGEFNVLRDAVGGIAIRPRQGGPRPASPQDIRVSIRGQRHTILDVITSVTTNYVTTNYVTTNYTFTYQEFVPAPPQVPLLGPDFPTSAVSPPSLPVPACGEEGQVCEQVRANGTTYYSRTCCSPLECRYSHESGYPTDSDSIYECMPPRSPPRPGIDMTSQTTCDLQLVSVVSTFNQGEIEALQNPAMATVGVLRNTLNRLPDNIYLQDILQSIQCIESGTGDDMSIK